MSVGTRGSGPGINCFSQDTAACLLVDGRQVITGAGAGRQIQAHRGWAHG